MIDNPNHSLNVRFRLKIFVNCFIISPFANELNMEKKANGTMNQGFTKDNCLNLSMLR